MNRCRIGFHKFGGYFYWHWIVARECERCGAIKVILI